MNEDLKQKIKLALTENPDKKITPAELEEALLSMADSIGEHPEQGSIIKNELFFDDGSGEVVPVKHPDLSTQPSILPYKFAGNYVYEQMFYVTSKQIYDSLDAGHIVELGKTEIQNVLVIDSFISCATHYGNTRTAPSSFIIYGTANSIELYVQSLEDASALIDEGLESCWIRVVYTTKPKAGGYYYASEPQSALIFKNIDLPRLEYGCGFKLTEGGDYKVIDIGEQYKLEGIDLEFFKRNDYAYSSALYIAYDFPYILEHNGYYVKARAGVWRYNTYLEYADTCLLSEELPTAYEDLENNKKVVVNMYRPWSIKLKISTTFIGNEPTVSVVRKSDGFVYCKLTQTGQECELPIEFLNNNYEIHFDEKGSYAGLSSLDFQEFEPYGQGSIIDIESIKLNMPMTYSAMINRQDVILDVEST